MAERLGKRCGLSPSRRLRRAARLRVKREAEDAEDLPNAVEEVADELLAKLGSQGRLGVTVSDSIDFVRAFIQQLPLAEGATGWNGFNINLALGRLYRF